MKFVAALIATLSVASAFAPATNQGRQVTELNALFDNIAGMNLFDPENNKYGAKEKKPKTKLGSIGTNSYVPAGLTASEYAAIRARDAKKKEENYKKNASKAFKFLDFTEFYLQRGTEEGGSWLKAPARGHRMAKTKYDYSGKKDEQKKLDSAGSIFGKK